MKKFFNLSLILMFFCFSSLMLIGCGEPKPRLFECEDGINITLTEDFNKVSNFDDRFACTYSYNDVKFTARKMLFNKFNRPYEEVIEWSYDDYAKVVATANNVDTENCVNLQDYQLSYFSFFTYNNTESNTLYHLVVIKKTNECFWLCDFSCKDKNKKQYGYKFLDWAKTIEVQ